LRPTVTDGVARSVGRSVSHDREPCKTAKPIDMSFTRWHREPCIRWDGVKIPTSKVVILSGKSGSPLQRRQRTRRTLCRISCAKTTEPIEMPFGTWIQVGPENHVLDGIQISTHKGEILRAKRGQPRTCRRVRRSIYLKLLSRKHSRYGADADWGALDGMHARWRNLTNTIEPSACGGDAAFLYQITLTPCY